MPCEHPLVGAQSPSSAFWGRPPPDNVVARNISIGNPQWDGLRDEARAKVQFTDNGYTPGAAARSTSW